MLSVSVWTFARCSLVVTVVAFASKLKHFGIESSVALCAENARSCGKTKRLSSTNIPTGRLRMGRPPCLLIQSSALAGSLFVANCDLQAKYSFYTYLNFK